MSHKDRVLRDLDEQLNYTSEESRGIVATRALIGVLLDLYEVLGTIAVRLNRRNGG